MFVAGAKMKLSTKLFICLFSSVIIATEVIILYVGYFALYEYNKIQPFIYKIIIPV